MRGEIKRSRGKEKMKRNIGERQMQTIKSRPEGKKGKLRGKEEEEK